MTLVAALIAAAAALLVTVVDRLWIASRERAAADRALRRELYASLVGAARTLAALSLSGTSRDMQGQAVTQLSAAMAQIELVAPPEVVRAAFGVGVRVGDDDALPSALEEFVTIARQDLSASL